MPNTITPPPTWLAPPGITVRELAEHRLNVTKTAGENWVKTLEQLTGHPLPRDPVSGARIVSPQAADVIVAAQLRCGPGGTMTAALRDALLASEEIVWIPPPAPVRPAQKTAPVAAAAVPPVEVLEHRAAERLVGRTASLIGDVAALRTDVRASLEALTGALAGQHEWDEQLHAEVAQLNGNVEAIRQAAQEAERHAQRAAEMQEGVQDSCEALRATITDSHQLFAEAARLSVGLMTTEQAQAAAQQQARLLALTIGDLTTRVARVEAAVVPDDDHDATWYGRAWWHVKRAAREQGLLAVVLSVTLLGGTYALNAPARAVLAQNHAQSRAVAPRPSAQVMNTVPRYCTWRWLKTSAWCTKR